MFGKLQKITFLLIIFSLSFQVGYHFWPFFAYVNGVRIDYLSPTLYLLDILIVAWIGLVLSSKNKSMNLNWGNTGITKILLGLFIFDIILNVLVSKSPGAHFFGLIKLGELGIFGWLIAKTFKKGYIGPFVRVLSLSAIISSLLAVWQFALQSSVGGLWYFLGERTFNITTVGISTVNLDHQILRPYGAFPHPNVLAYFLLMSVVFATLRLPFEKSKNWKLFITASITVSTFALFLTFSRMTVFLLISLLLYEVFSKGKRNTWLAYGVLAILCTLGILFIPGEFLFRGIDFRQELLSQSVIIFNNNPYFGIGLNNFFVHQSDLIKNISPIVFQPVHNIFILAFLSLGLVGWLIFPAIFILAFRSLSQKLRIKNQELKAFYRGVFLLLISVIVVGTFDHFFLTLEQGQLTLALILGLSFSDLSQKVST